MVLWIGVDDTDSLRGMCTTFLATEIVRDLTQDFDLIGYPRLVRLNPNIPWKTRGNGAICLRVGHGRGLATTIGEIGGTKIRSYSRGSKEVEASDVVGRIANLVERWSCFDDPTTNPAFVVLRRPPSAPLYWHAVRRVVTVAEARRAIRGLGVVRSYKQGRGIVGAAAATAWRPRDRTYEILAYREPGAWGTRRIVEPDSVMAMDRTFLTTFNNYDYDNGRAVITPRSPCPILLGIRGDRPQELEPAMGRIKGERAERWLIFETNQGTDDHVTRGRPRERFTTVDFGGLVTAAPRTIAGGHVVFSVGGDEVTAYEPSKQFRRVVRLLMPGDEVRVIGAVRGSPKTVNLEKIEIVRLAETTRKVANPRCPDCDGRMKSRGSAAEYRCPRCGRREPRSQEMRAPVVRGLEVGWYEPPVGSRRHLSKPLKRMGVSPGLKEPSREQPAVRGRESDTSPRNIGSLWKATR
jgi:tRNA(Ile2)-agmatinylcytidine synthase